MGGFLKYPLVSLCTLLVSLLLVEFSTILILFFSCSFLFSELEVPELLNLNPMLFPTFRPQFESGYGSESVKTEPQGFKSAKVAHR